MTAFEKKVPTTNVEKIKLKRRRRRIMRRKKRKKPSTKFWQTEVL